MFNDPRQRAAEELWQSTISAPAPRDITIGISEAVDSLLRWVDGNGLYMTLGHTMYLITGKRRLRDCTLNEVQALDHALKNAAAMQATHPA